MFENHPFGSYEGKVVSQRFSLRQEKEVFECLSGPNASVRVMMEGGKNWKQRVGEKIPILQKN